MEDAACFEAATGVLETTELLENIMRFLDMKTLLLSQRVDKRWRTTIKDSIMLQKKLFMRPAALEDIVDLDLTETRQEGELLALQDLQRTEINGKHSSQFSIVNPLLFDFVKTRNGQLLRHCLKNTAVEGSWRNMQIGQPPLSGFYWLCSKGRESCGTVLREERRALKMQKLRHYIVATGPLWMSRHGDVRILSFWDECLTERELKEMMKRESKAREETKVLTASAVKHGGR